MKPPAIYADFNGMQESSRSPELCAVPLHTMGSLMDLSRLGLVLSDGLALTIHMDSDKNEDIEATATVYFDPGFQQWVAEIDRSLIRDVPMYDRESDLSFPCASCGAALSLSTEARGLSFDDGCPKCGKPINAPLSPPTA